MAWCNTANVAANADYVHVCTKHLHYGHLERGASILDAVTEAREAELSEVLAVVQQAVAMDGGAVSLVSADYDAGSVRVLLTGACGACALVGATAEQGVERVLKQRLDWVKVVDVLVDNSDVSHSRSLGRGGFKPL